MLGLWLLALSPLALAQPVPQPFPRPAEPGAPRPTAPAQPPAQPAQPQTPPGQGQPVSPGQGQAPDEAALGLPIYPNARFIASYDAGMGQRYYLFGVSAPFAEIVAYYRSVLKSRGSLVFEQPPVHMFETGRFREESMAFPPSVTVKDYTWGGSQGYLVPLPGGRSERYPTIIQIVPAPPGARR